MDTNKGDVEDDDLLAASILSSGVQHAPPSLPPPQHHPNEASIQQPPPQHYAASQYGHHASYGMHQPGTSVPQSQYAYGSMASAVHNGEASQCVPPQGEGHYGSSHPVYIGNVPLQQAPVMVMGAAVRRVSSVKTAHPNNGQNGYHSNIASYPSSPSVGGHSTSDDSDTPPPTATTREDMFQHQRMRALDRGRKRAHSDMPYSRPHSAAGPVAAGGTLYEEEEDGSDGPSQRDVAHCIMELMKTTRERKSSTSSDAALKEEPEEIVSPRLVGRKRANTISGTSTLAPRNVHNAKEQKRRNDIRDAFEDLRKRLPATEVNVSKSEILRKACEHIQFLKERDQLLQREAGALTLSLGDREKRKKQKHFRGIGEKIMVAAA